MYLFSEVYEIDDSVESEGEHRLRILRNETEMEGPLEIKTIKCILLLRCRTRDR